MSKIVIRDWSENVELDRKAMQAIAGGSLFCSHAGMGATQQQVRGERLVDFRTGAVPRPDTK